ncbi:PREDICTED: uncharacterized protein LOC108571244 [Habropoda laboriosa]|uniref:uncharacterized protein LOC108571244 n=1 Tax=Habropoda laboriosa TaxID=597456 RepID=UPI00083D1A4D|nr:PREDICTED: uncharacterized protein LOC108571244 [Habropoda laboriosa]
MSRKTRKYLENSTDDIKFDNDRQEETEKKDDEPSSPAETTEEPPKHVDANVVYPFHDAKPASFPPPLPPDAAAHSDPKEQVASAERNGKQVPEAEEKEKKDEVEDEIKDEDKSDEKIRPLVVKEVCDEKSCAKENCSPDSCEKPVQKSSQQSEDKIIHMKLTELINSSIQEAMQTIVKQCRMVFKMQNEEQTTEKKAKEGVDKSVCDAKNEGIPVKIRHENRPRTTQDQLNDRSRVSKASRLRERYKNVRSSPQKLHDKKGNVLEEIRNKRHSKSANNVKTDNRRMTGNVNIYICSEANENAQQTRKQKKAETCTESSSETTTEQSKVSSSKLVTCIRNKRRKSKEQNSIDSLSGKEESSDDSTICTCVSKYTDSISESNRFIEVCGAFDKDVCAKNTESTLTDCECTQTNINNVQLALDKPKFVVCDKREEPCSTIYPMKSLSNSDSEDWSTKSSSRNADCIDKWSLEPNSEHSNSYVNNLKGSYPVSEDDSCEASARRNLERVCKCGKKGGESTGRYSMRCNCKKRSSKTVEQENLMQPWLICNCIREEEEEDCVDDKASKKFAEEKEEMTVCRGALENLEEPKLVPCADYSGESRKSREKLKEALEKDEKREVKDTEEGGVEEVPAKVEESEEKSTKSVRRTSMPFASRKLIRPEVMVLRNILKHEVKQPAQTVDQKSVAPVKKADSLEQPVKNGGKTTQDILKRFNIPEEYKFLKKPAAEEEQTGEKNEKVEEKKVEVKGNKEDKDTKNLQGKLKNTFAFKRLKKILGKTEFPEKRDEGSIGKDKINESTSNVGDVKNVENPKTNVDGDQLPVKDNEIKGRHKEKERFNFSKLNLYRTMKNKKDKPEQNTTTNSPTIKEHKNSDKSDNVIDASVKKEDTQETTSEIDKETKNKSKQTPVVANENSPALPTQDDTQLTKRGNSENSQKLSEPKRIIKNPKVDEPAKRTQFEKKLNIQEEKKADPEEPTIQDERKPTRKLSFNEMKESSPSQHPQHHKIDPRTICTNSKYPKSSTMNESFTSICNCCCSSISEYTNEPINYPKSCLKKDRTLYQHVDSQRSNFSLPYRDKRSWEDCGCRRIIPCNVCCRPRNDAR